MNERIREIKVNGRGYFSRRNWFMRNFTNLFEYELKSPAREKSLIENIFDASSQAGFKLGKPFDYSLLVESSVNYRSASEAKRSGLIKEDIINKYNLMDLSENGLDVEKDLWKIVLHATGISQDKIFSYQIILREEDQSLDKRFPINISED